MEEKLVEGEERKRELEFQTQELTEIIERVKERDGKGL